MKVFIVNSVMKNCARIVESVQAAGGLVVGEANNQFTAETLIPKTNSDLMVIDLDLFQGNGLELIRAIDRSLLNLTCVVLTDESTDENRSNYLANGASFFFDKENGYSKFETFLECYAKIA